MLGEDLSLVVLRNTLRGFLIPPIAGHRTMTDPVPVRNRPEIIRSPRPRPRGGHHVAGGRTGNGRAGSR
jgi:hypothetical protein